MRSIIIRGVLHLINKKKYKQMKQRYILLAFFVLLFGQAIAQRSQETINDGWKFIKSDVSGAAASAFDDAQWEQVMLPHTWNATDAYIVKDYYRGVGWYRKSLLIPQSQAGRKLFLRFDGAASSAEVFINGSKVSVHSGGYTAFSVDATQWLKVGGKNIIAVRVDNSLQDVPPLSGDFSIFGGIYRDVWLISTGYQHFNLVNLASPGVFVETPTVSEDAATVQIKGSIANDEAAAKKVSVKSIIYSPDGNTVAEITSKLSLKPNAAQEFMLVSKPIAKPLLWSPDAPNLYKVQTQIVEEKTGKIIDAVSSPLGFRWYSVDAGKRFNLNGQPLQLIGVCRHQDYKWIGNALSDEMHRRDMQLVKESGANFVRISHYPQDDAILEYCDKLGLLVWEEIPVVDLVSLNEEFSENCKTNLREMIRQHYNHPSVVMWGYMNEVILKTVRNKEITEEQRQAIYKQTLKLAKELEQILHEEDKNRLSVMALHGDRKTYHEIGLSAVPNIVGWNLYQGWYGGDFSGFDKFMDGEKLLHPDYAYIISEYGAGADKRLHTFAPESFDFSIEYQQNYHEHYLKAIKERDYILGATMWNFIDFGSANRDESMPRINNKGLVYSDRTPKDVYYLYKAVLNEKPMLYIASRDWQNRVVMSDVQLQPLKIYTNQSKVELFVNGKSQGVKSATNSTVSWNVALNEGSNFVLAKAGNLEDAATISYQAIPAQLNKSNLQGLELAVNVGSSCYFTDDDSKLTWVPDRAYTPGGWGYVGGEVYRTSSSRIGTQVEIANTRNTPLLQTLRVGVEAYRFDVPEGDYEVELLFADPFAQVQATLHALGGDSKESAEGNIFNVSINGKQVLENLNLQQQYGSFSAVKKRFLLKVNKGENLEVKLDAVKGKAMLNGIKIRLL